MSSATDTGTGGHLPLRVLRAVCPEAIRKYLILLLFLSVAGLILRVVHGRVLGDEYMFLSQIYRAHNGWPLSLLQTAYVHLFGWLPLVGGYENSEITLARLIYVPVWIGSLYLLYRIGCQLMGRLEALAGVALFALFSNSVQTAASFRIDGLVLPALLGIALLLLNPTRARVSAAGALSGLATALTIKAALWAPALVGILAVGLWGKRDRFRPVIAGILAALACFGIIMLAHSWLISTPHRHLPGVSGRSLWGTFSYMFLENSLFPQPAFLAIALLSNLGTCFLVIVGTCLTSSELGDRKSRRDAALLLLLALPVLSVAFYANSYAYVYLILMPGPCLLAGKAFSRYLGTGGGLKVVTAVACLAAAALPLVLSVWGHRTDQQASQKQMLSAVHDIIASPVFYIAGGAPVPSFRNQGFLFLSGLGMRTYKARGIPMMARYIRDRHSPLLIADVPPLDVWNKEALARVDPRLRLLPEDEQTLRATYAHYWGQIYLAGRQWSGVEAGKAISFALVINGDYTLIARHAVIIDSRSLGPGGTVNLDAGPHQLTTTGSEPDLRLLWGKGLKLPPSPRNTAVVAPEEK